MKNQIIDQYTDYLIPSKGQTSCTGLSSVLDGGVSHDKFKRLFSENNFSSKDLWEQANPIVREVEIEIDDRVLVFDDSIAEKPYTDKNELICWHYDQSKGRSMKGINLLMGLYVGDCEASHLLVNDLVKKDLVYCSGKKSSSRSKNEMMRDCLDVVIKNRVKFKWVMTDIWFAISENMKAIKSRG